MKKTILFFLLTAFFLQSGGLLLIYQFELLTAKETMQATIKNHSADKRIIKLTFRELEQFSLNRKEIIYKGKLYDIGKKSYKDGMIVLEAYEDNYEYGILNKIASWFQNHNKPDKKLPKSFIQLQKLSCNISNLTLEFTSAFKLTTFTDFSQNIIHPAEHEVISPPPEC